MWISFLCWNIIVTFYLKELFDSIAPQNTEIPMVTNLLPLFFNRLSQADQNLKYNTTDFYQTKNQPYCTILFF
jgi:hypothetical protein